MNQLIKKAQKNPRYTVSLLLFLLSLYMATRLTFWSSEPQDEFIPVDGNIVQYGGSCDNNDSIENKSFREANALGKPFKECNQAPSITNDIGLYLSPEGGQNIEKVIGMEEQIKNNPCTFGYNGMTAPDKESLAVAKTKATCRPREDWNYVAQAGGSNNSVTFPGDPRDPKQSEFYNQFFRDVQNNLSEHSVENFRYPSSSTLTSSYRNSPQYCGIGKTIHDRIPNDHCFNTDEYQNFYNKDESAPNVINTQIKPYNRRLRSQIKYTPVRLYDEIIPANGFLNEKPANFTSEQTRTFDWFTNANLGHVDYLY